MPKFSAPLEHTALVLAKAGTLPYPSQWERHLVLDGGWKIFARPVRPTDEPLILHLLQQVSKEDLRLRFFDSIKQFNHPFLVRLTQLDYARAMAFVALDEANLAATSSGVVVGFTPIRSVRPASMRSC